MRFYGTVGFVETQKVSPGVYQPVLIAERQYYGDVLRWSPRTETSNDKANDEINVNNQISILADPFANNHLTALKYVVWLGVKWRIRDVTVNYPRLTLEIGDIYPEEEVDSDDDSNDSPEYED